MLSLLECNEALTQETNANVFLLCSYNNWFEWSSQKIEGVFSSPNKAYEAIKEIEGNCILVENGKNQWFVYNEDEECLGGYMIDELTIDKIESI